MHVYRSKVTRFFGAVSKRLINSDLSKISLYKATVKKTSISRAHLIDSLMIAHHQSASLAVAQACTTEYQILRLDLHVSSYNHQSYTSLTVLTSL